MALDWGTRYVGIAIADELGICAHPYGSWDPTQADFDTRIRVLCEEKGIGGVIVGLPLDLSGREDIVACASRELAQRVAVATGLEVRFIDERFSSVQARKILRKNGRRCRKSIETRIHAVSAALLLQTVLESYRRSWALPR